jgi:O-antigen/teichoic acid export membrane protein
VTPERRGFAGDVVWNITGLAVAGACGILLNFLIGLRYGAATLGVFNQVFAAFSLGSQFGTLGLHYSALRAAAAADSDAERRLVVASALLCTAAVGTIAAGAFAASASGIAALVDSPGVAHGIRLAAPGLLFFALSKVALGSLNGLQRMRTYAVLYAGRFVLMVAGFLACAALEVDGESLPIIVTLSEGTILLGSLVALRRHLRGSSRAALWTRAGEHLRFGAKGFMSGVFELFARVDILVVGAFAGDADVGAFSFAATLFEGLYQIFFVLRINYAPLLVRLWRDGKRGELQELIRRARNRTYAGAALMGAIAVAGYALVLPLISADADFVQSRSAFAVLICGAALGAGYNPFLPLLLYTGQPARNTVLMLIVFAVNAVGNLLLVPWLGALGSACATAAALLSSAVLLRAVAARQLGLRI